MQVGNRVSLNDYRGKNKSTWVSPEAGTIASMEKVNPDSPHGIVRVNLDSGAKFSRRSWRNGP
jgi:hypothetical protein